MALKVILEGTPASFPVQPFNAASPVYWEAGQLGTLDNNGNGVVYGGTGAVFGLLADRRNTTVGIANANYLPSNPGAYGDESLFNQPGYGNSLYGTTNGVNNVIPANTIPTTTLLRDETAANPNADSRYVTMYIRGGVYATDQFDPTSTFVPGASLYANASGQLSTTVAGSVVAVCTKAVDGNGLLTFKLEVV
jgi:hypothetical protein